MKAKKRVTVLVFSVILTFIGRSNCNVETDCDNLTFLTYKWSQSHRLIDSVTTPCYPKLYRQFPTLHFFVYKIFFVLS